MSLPDLIRSLDMPQPASWQILPGDESALIFEPSTTADEVDCTDCYIEVTFRDLNDEIVLADEVEAEWIDQTVGSFEVSLPIEATAIFADFVSADEPQKTVGHYRIAYVDDDTEITQRKTIRHGPLVVRFSAAIAEVEAEPEGEPTP